MSLGDLGVGSINGGPTGVINAIINGNFGINQRGVSGTVTLTAGVYGHDRWKAGSGGCTYTFATSANVTTLTITAGTLIQVIEGLNLASGTYTLSFTGTAQGKIGAGSFAASGVTGAAVGGTNLNIEFNTGTVSLVQFEQGSVATPFERRPFGTELSLCQRYFQLIDGFYAVGFNSTILSGSIGFAVEMRASPSLSVSGALETTDFVSANFTQSSGSVSISGAGARVSTRGVMAEFGNFTSITTHRVYGNLPQVNRLILSSEL